MNLDSFDSVTNMDETIKLNRDIASRIAELKRKYYESKVSGPIELTQRSNKPNNSIMTSTTLHNILQFSHEEKQLLIKELSCRLNIQGLTIEQFLTGRIEITQEELIVILINKLKFSNQYVARRVARLIFEISTFDTQEKRQIDDIVYQIKGELQCSCYNRNIGKQMFQKLGLKIRNRFYHSMVNNKVIDYHMVEQLLFCQGLDVYEVNQTMCYILQCSAGSSFYSLQLRSMLIKQQGSNQEKKKDKYEKKESILTKSSSDRERQNSESKKKEEINFLDCQIQVIDKHEYHKCGVYNCDH